MISVARATDDDRSRWDAFVAMTATAEPYHPYDWRKVFENAFGHRCFYLLATREDGAVCGVLPLVQLKSRLFGNFLVSVPCFSYCGTLAEDEVSRDALIEAAWRVAEEVGARHVELRHPGNIEADRPYRDDRVAMRLDLPASEDDLWARFPSKLRAQIRRPSKEGAVCEDGAGELLGDFYRVFSRNMRDLGTPVFPKSLFEQMCRYFPDSTRVFVVRLNGTPCAAGITYGFRDRIEIPSASSLRAYNRTSVNMLLYWSAIRYAIERGYRVFDFGRSAVDGGTYRFKKQWGALPQALRWHYCLPENSELPRLNPQNAKFRLAIRLWQRLPLTVANALGPRIVRNLP